MSSAPPSGRRDGIPPANPPIPRDASPKTPSVADRIHETKGAIGEGNNTEAKERAQIERPLIGRVSAIIDYLLSPLYALGRAIKSLVSDSKVTEKTGDDLSFNVDTTLSKEALVGTRDNAKRQLNEFKEKAIYLANAVQISRQGYVFSREDHIIETRINQALRIIDFSESPEEIVNEIDRAKKFILKKYPIESELDNPNLSQLIKIAKDIDELTFQYSELNSKVNMAEIRQKFGDDRTDFVNHQFTLAESILSLQSKLIALTFPESTLEPDDYNAKLEALTHQIDELKTSVNKLKNLLSEMGYN